MYTWMETGAVSVKYLAQEHNTMSPGRTWTWTPWSRSEHTNHDEATAYPTAFFVLSQFCNDRCKVHFVSWVIIVSSKHFIGLIYFLQAQFPSILLVYHHPHYNSIIAMYTNSVSVRFQLLQGLIDDSETDLETQWEESKKLWWDTCEEVLGKQKAQHKEWISADTIQRSETRKVRKTVLNTSQTRAAKSKDGRIHSSR